MSGKPTHILEVLSGKLAGRSFGIAGSRAILVGRSAAAHLRLEHESVSRAHCLVVFDPAGASLYDLHSRSGTWIGARRVEKTALMPGDSFQVGEVKLRLGGERGVASDIASSSAEIAAFTGSVAELPACERCERVLFDKELKSRHTHYLYGVVFCAACGVILETQPEDFPGYKVLGELGRGGMGDVYKAVDLKRERVVAIKTVRFAREASTMELQYFAREVKLCRSLKHPNIVRIYSVARHQSQIYFTMSYVSGETLQSMVERAGPVSSGVALRILRQMASALELARKHHVVHRNVKPANILLDRNGQGMLADFGLAKSYADAALSGLTQSGDRLIGTPYFMAPEQVSNPKGVDHRADLFSLGAVLYFALAGKKPFEAETLAECLFKLVRDDPVRLTHVNPEVPKPVEAIVKRLMEKDPNKRFQTAGEIVKILRAIDPKPTGKW